jgi:glycosyltransferase involved in cell wall biosynthesis
VKDGDTGHLVEYGDVEAFANKSLELIADRQEWNRMSEQAIQWAGSLTWDRTAQAMEAIFLEEVEASKRGSNV